jgi:hypothetical protein
MTSLEVSRRTQVVRHYHYYHRKTVLKTMKTTKTMKTMKTTKTMKTMKTTQVTEEEEGKSNAGGSASEGKTAIPAKKAPLQQVSDIPKAPLIQAGVVSPGAQGSAALPQATEVGESKQAAGDPIGDTDPDPDPQTQTQTQTQTQDGGDQVPQALSPASSGAPSPTWFPFSPRGRNITSGYKSAGSRRHGTESTRIPCY